MQVVARTIVAVDQQPPSVEITSSDVARGYVDVPSAVAFRIRTYGLDVGSGQAWVDRILAHPAMLQWERQALAETWREESHEAELAECGRITIDYRAGAA